MLLYRLLRYLEEVIAILRHYPRNCIKEMRKLNSFGSRFESANCGKIGEQTTTAIFSENEGVPTITKTTLRQPKWRHPLLYARNKELN